MGSSLIPLTTPLWNVLRGQEMVPSYLKMPKGQRTCQSGEESGLGLKEKSHLPSAVCCRAAGGGGRVDCLQKYHLPLIRSLNISTLVAPDFLPFIKGLSRKGTGWGGGLSLSTHCHWLPSSPPASLVLESRREGNKTREWRRR